MDQPLNSSPPDLSKWISVKERGAISHTGTIYRSLDGSLYLRTGNEMAIRAEAEFAKAAWREGFPVPEVTDAGVFATGVGYFVETSAGIEDFGRLLGREFAETGRISDVLFEAYCGVTLRFLAAQLKPSCRQPWPSQLREGVRLENVLRENPDVPENLFERAVAKAEERTRELPLVLTHGDMTPFNVMPGGVIDFEERFIAPAGYDAITCVTFQRFWDHPLPDGSGTMRSYDFNRTQIDGYLREMDTTCAAAGTPALSPFFDDFLTLKAIWALCYERPSDMASSQVARWNWRRRVAMYCAERYLSDAPIESELFRSVGLAS